MQVFINSFPKSAEFISAYVDTKLRRSVSSASDTLGEASLDEILQIFRCAPHGAPVPLCSTVLGLASGTQQQQIVRGVCPLSHRSITPCTIRAGSSS